MNFIGIDPGQSGGMVLLNREGGLLFVTAFNKATEGDIASELREWDDIDNDYHAIACLEAVHSMPKQGVASSFKFGVSYGFLRGILTGLNIRWDTVTPQKWQKVMGCMTKGDKNVSKAAAQRLWPNTKWTHAIADAALIAEYARRTSK
jgi:hypothetical protein